MGLKIMHCCVNVYQNNAYTMLNSDTDCNQHVNKSHSGTDSMTHANDLNC